MVLHFGAVDYRCEAFVNGVSAGRHTGGYVSFAFDVTELVHHYIYGTETQVAPDETGTTAAEQIVVKSKGEVDLNGTTTYYPTETTYVMKLTSVAENNVYTFYYLPYRTGTITIEYYLDDALLTEYDENAPEDDGEPKDAYIMEVRPVEGDDEMEEFVAIEEALAEKLIDIFQSGGLDEDEEYEIGEAPEEE